MNDAVVRYKDIRPKYIAMIDSRGGIICSVMESLATCCVPLLLGGDYIRKGVSGWKKIHTQIYRPK
jgi:hypothetical protein